MDHRYEGEKEVQRQREWIGKRRKMQAMRLSWPNTRYYALEILVSRKTGVTSPFRRAREARLAQAELFESL